MTIGEIDTRRLREWAAVQVPAALTDQLRIEVDVRGDRATVYEGRAPSGSDASPAWTRMSFAQLRYDGEVWALFHVDLDSHWHPYELAPPTAELDVLLGAIDADVTGVFKG